METDNFSAESPGDKVSAPPSPQAAAWLWRPWYAKLWWMSAALYWAGMLGSFWTETLDRIYSTATAGLLNVFFFPPTIAMVLAAGLVRAWMEYKELGWGPASSDQLFPNRSVGGFLDPMADPLDPRSAKYWKRHDRD